MIQVRMLKTFNTKYGFRRAGETFWSEPGYVKQLERIGGMIEVVRDDEAPIAPAIQPERNQAFPRAPATKGKVSETDSQPPLSPDPNSAAAKDDGPATPSPLSRAGRRSRTRTSTPAEPDAK